MFGNNTTSLARIASILLVVLATSFSAAAALETPDCRMLIGTNADAFDDDSVFSIGGPEIKGTTLIFVNDEPVAVYRGHGMSVSLNRWLIQGENSIRLVGAYNNAIFIKVAAFGSGEKLSLIAKQAFKSKVELQLLKFVMKAWGTRPGIGDALPETEVEQKAIRSQIKERVDILVEAVKKQDGKAIAEFYSQGMTRLMKAEEKLPAEIERALAGTVTFYGDPQLVPGPIQTEHLTVVLGRRTALVYRHDDEGLGGYLFKFQKGGASYSMRPLHMILVEGKWLAWI